MNQKLSTLKITSLPWRVFIGTMIAMFVMVVLKHLGLSIPQFKHLPFLSPVSTNASIFNELKPSLEQKPNTYYLQKPSAFVPTAHAAADYDNASSYAVIDYDSGNVILQKGLSKEVPIASLTKIMTSVVALDLASPDELLTADTTAATIEPTRINVKPGEKLTLNELLQAALMTSANDAAQTIKEGIDAKYGTTVFVKAMNVKAEFLGLKHTHFANPQGFDDPDNYSTAEDLAILSHYALTNYPLIKQIVANDYTVLPQNATHGKFTLYNWNSLLGVYPGVTGIKIGNTGDAGNTMIVISERNGKKLLAVVLGADGILQRDLWTTSLLDDGFLEIGNLPPVNVTIEDLRAKYATWQYGG